MVCLSRSYPSKFFEGCLPDVKNFIDNNDLGIFNLHELFSLAENLGLKVVQPREFDKDSNVTTKRLQLIKPKSNFHTGCSMSGMWLNQYLGHISEMHKIKDCDIRLVY